MKNINIKGVDGGTWVRIGGMILILANQIAVSLFNFQLLPFEDEEIYEGLTVVLTAAWSIYTLWKNNSVTKEAQLGDQVAHQLKEGNTLLNVGGQEFVQVEDAPKLMSYQEFTEHEQGMIENVRKGVEKRGE